MEDKEIYDNYMKIFNEYLVKKGKPFFKAYQNEQREFVVPENLNKTLSIGKVYCFTGKGNQILVIGPEGFIYGKKNTTPFLCRWNIVTDYKNYLIKEHKTTNITSGGLLHYNYTKKYYEFHFTLPNGHSYSIQLDSFKSNEFSKGNTRTGVYFLIQYIIEWYLNNVNP